MYLKTLTLKGFKSFAEATTIELEPGVTVVVGPNGSGKSNVVDAVAWVLGAQGPKVVRSQKMEDVIFAGSGKRPALGRAEVSLTIDNASRTLPVDLSEITITRVLFRSGDSEYSLNGVPCRLLDIQELLSDSGVGRTQHVIVGQGQLDWVLNSRPEERRTIIEEAAGVLKYRKRREKAERRMEATHGDLQRLQDLLSEVRRSMRPLERQADAARRHGALAEELGALRLYMAGREIATLAKAGESLGAQRQELAEASEQLTRNLRGLDERVGGLESQLDGLRGDDVAGLHGTLSALRERAMGLARVIAERKRSLLQAAEATRARGEAARRLAAERASLEEEIDGVAAEAASTGAAESEARASLEAAEAAVAAVESSFRIAESDHQRWAARAEALEQALQAARARAGAERLAGIDGVLGAIAEVVEVDEGWELAFEAAIGEVVAAVVVDSEEAVESALVRFSQMASGGAVLAVGAAGPAGSPVVAPELTLGSGCQPVRSHVRSARPELGFALDGLLAGAVVVDGGWREAFQVAKARPDLVVVTRAGDRFSDGLWRVGTGGTGANMASLEQARAEEAAAARAANNAQETLEAAKEARSEARAVHQEAAHAATRAGERERLMRQRWDALVVSSGSGGPAGAGGALEFAEIDADPAPSYAGSDARLDALARVVSDGLRASEEALAELTARRDAQARRVSEALHSLEEARRTRASTEHELAATREKSQRTEIDLAENRMRSEAAVESLRRDLDCEPEVAIAAECPPLPPGTTANQRTRELERELKLLGPINPLALEELTALQERHDFLAAQMEDVKTARRDLTKVLRAIDAEIQEVFAEAFEDVSSNFTALFSTLFPGGASKLVLTDPSNLLDTGVEVEARPAGKNVKKLSLLSGGERALVAMAFLFAVFRSRPSPFYILDEVEAALDDVNLSRFLDLLDEFRREAQLIVVSHQKRTMEQGDCLYGVTMAPGGSSKVVAERLNRGEPPAISGAA